ncbi:MAG TPA: hypothetical protein VGP07_00670 [Polyangia bacterium]
MLPPEPVAPPEDEVAPPEDDEVEPPDEDAVDPPEEVDVEPPEDDVEPPEDDAVEPPVAVLPPEPLEPPEDEEVEPPEEEDEPPDPVEPPEEDDVEPPEEELDPPDPDPPPDGLAGAQLPSRNRLARPVVTRSRLDLNMDSPGGRRVRAHPWGTSGQIFPLVRPKTSDCTFSHDFFMPPTKKASRGNLIPSRNYFDAPSGQPRFPR